MKRVYVAGPLSVGNKTRNVRRAMLAGLALIRAGYAPYVPHLSHFMELLEPQLYKIWIDIDLEWLAQCEALIRLPGESEGSDDEVEFATRRKIPVFGSVDEFLEHEGWPLP